MSPYGYSEFMRSISHSECDILGQIWINRLAYIVRLPSVTWDNRYFRWRNSALPHREVFAVATAGTLIFFSVSHRGLRQLRRLTPGYESVAPRGSPFHSPKVQKSFLMYSEIRAVASILVPLKLSYKIIIIEKEIRTFEWLRWQKRSYKIFLFSPVVKSDAPFGYPTCSNNFNLLQKISWTSHSEYDIPQGKRSAQRKTRRSKPPGLHVN